jgi:SAM-dependent methyltransferase
MDYQEEYFKKNKDWHSADSFEKVRRVNLLLEKHRDFKIKTVLDIACGNGSILLHFLKNKNFEKVLGVDISKKAIELAEKNDKEKKADWRILDILKDEIKKFDLVLALDIVEHIDDKLFLQRIKNKGRYFIFKVPIEDNFLNIFFKKVSFGKIDQQKDSLEKYGHINYYTEDRFLMILKQENYKIIDKIRMPLPKRSKLFREFLRIIFLPVWFISEKYYLKFNGGFIVILCSE